jgi:hypothetical protein
MNPKGIVCVCVCVSGGLLRTITNLCVQENADTFYSVVGYSGRTLIHKVSWMIVKFSSDASHVCSSICVILVSKYLTCTKLSLRDFVNILESQTLKPHYSDIFIPRFGWPSVRNENPSTGVGSVALYPFWCLFVWLTEQTTCWTSIQCLPVSRTWTQLRLCSTIRLPNCDMKWRETDRHIENNGQRMTMNNLKVAV